MRKEIEWVIYCLGLGFILLAYAHANFATKSTVEKMDDRIYDIWVVVAKDKIK